MVTGLTLCVQACLAALGLITCMCAVPITQWRVENPVGWKSHVKKGTPVIIIIFIIFLAPACSSHIVAVVYETICIGS